MQIPSALTCCVKENQWMQLAHKHAGPFASHAPGAVTSSREAMRRIERGSMFSNHQDLEVCFTASTETFLHHHTLLPAERAAVKQKVSTGNLARDAALNPNGHRAASLRLWWSCHCRKSSDRPGGIATSNSLALAYKNVAELAGSFQVLLFYPSVKTASTTTASLESRLDPSIWVCSEKDGQSSPAACKGPVKKLPNTLYPCLVTQWRRKYKAEVSFGGSGNKLNNDLFCY